MFNFRQQALDEEFHPAATEKYLRLTSTSVYMVLATMLLLAVALVMWVIMGSVTDKVMMGGVVSSNSLNSSNGSSGSNGSNSSNGSSGSNVCHVIAFADYKTLQELCPNQEVRVKPMSLNHNSTKYIPGHIISISRQQVSRQEELRKMKLLQFEQGVFPKSGVAYEVQIAVLARCKRQSRANNEQFLLDASGKAEGTINREQIFCNVQVITKRRSILQYLFERLKE